MDDSVAIRAVPSQNFERLARLLPKREAEQLRRALGNTTRDSEAAPVIPRIEGGILRWVESEEYSESFGFQWNRFEVRQQQEDEETFVVKTGIPLIELAGKTVLDAGCGGGRYTRVCAEHGAGLVVGADRSRAVEKARDLCSHLENVAFLQADLTDLPFADDSFDLVFSIGVLHHGPDARSSFDSVARLVKPGGRLSVWLYRRATTVQEWINEALRRRTTRMTHKNLLRWSKAGATFGGIPVISKLANKIVSFSTHPNWENRVCDTFDWYSPKYQSHHTVPEIAEWFEAMGFTEVRELLPANVGKAYLFAHGRGWLIGSGVNLTGIRI